MTTISTCRNCKTKPVVTSSDDSDYKFVLRHKSDFLCHPTYKLESYQDTKSQCVEDWNKFNLPK